MHRSWIFIILLSVSFFTLWIIIDFVQPWDEHVLLLFERIRTPIFTRMFNWITTLGSIKILLPFTIIFSFWLAWKRSFWEIPYLFVVFFGSRYVNHLLKNWIERERPTLDPLIYVGEYSFPSGHVMNSIVVISFIYYLFFHGSFQHDRLQTPFLFAVMLVITSISSSRMYLGVHYPSDILAGLSIGGVFLLLSINVHKWVLTTKWFR